MGCWKSREHIELLKILNCSSVRPFGRTPKAKSIKLDGVGVDYFCTKQDAVGHVFVGFRPVGTKTVAVKLHAFIFGAVSPRWIFGRKMDGRVVVPDVIK